MTLTKFQYEVLEGLMLGDGHLSIGGKSRNPRLRINRAGTSLTYAQWIADVFKPFTTPKSLGECEVFDKRYGKTYSRVTFNTRRRPAFLPAFVRWYNHREKRVPRDVVLSPVTIAVWLADDGSVHRKSGGGVELKFNTSGFTRASVEYLAALLNEQFEGGFGVYGGYKGSAHFVIMASTRPARRLLAEVNPVFPPHPKRKAWVDYRDWLPNPRCPQCGTDTVFKNGRYSGRGTVPLAQRFKCRRCGGGWKEWFKPTPNHPQRRGSR